MQLQTLRLKDDCLHLVILSYFAISISAEDLRVHKIRNRELLYFLCLLTLFSLMPLGSDVHLLAAIEFLGTFVVFHFLGNAIHSSGGIGFGDVKLIAVLAFGYFETGLQSIEIFIISLWVAVVVHICLYLLMYRKWPYRIAIAPDIFLACGLYLYAPIGLLLPQ